MTFTDAAREVLRQLGKPLHYKEITELAIEKNLLSHVGKSPEVTMGARLAATLKKGGDDNPLVRVKPGVFALREWDAETIRVGLEAMRGKKQDEDDEDPFGDGLEIEDADRGEPSAPAAPEPVLAAPAPAAQRPSPPIEDVPRGPDEELRAEMAASGAAIFDAEEDDDQPILRMVDDEAAPDGEGPGRGRRRRRRRRRGGRDDDRQGMPSYTATPVAAPNHADRGFSDWGPGRRDRDNGSRAHDDVRGLQVIDLSAAELPALDALAGRELSDAVAVLLGSFDRAVGAVSLRQLAESAQRAGKLAGDGQLMQSQITASVRADNSRRAALGLRPRFRLAAGRIGLTEWLFEGELARAERDATTAIERYREAARRAFAGKAAELPGHAFVELCLLLLERLGVSELKAVRFPGASGAETQLCGALHLPAGALPGRITTGEPLRLGIVVRKDGRDVGRERVTELRGSLHHFDDARMGWILTAGQVLSGAREEANAQGSLPIALADGLGIARLCEEHNVAVIRAQHPVALVDADLFEALRSS